MKAKRFLQLRSLELIHGQQHIKYLKVSLKQFFSSQIESSYHEKVPKKSPQVMKSTVRVSTHQWKGWGTVRIGGWGGDPLATLHGGSRGGGEESIHSFNVFSLPDLKHQNAKTDRLKDTN